MKPLHPDHPEIISARCRHRQRGDGTGIMNETESETESREFHNHPLLTRFCTSLCPFLCKCHPGLNTFHSFVPSFIHSSAIVPVSFDSPLLLSSPLGELNGSWRRCGTLCCFQEALLNAVCPVALSPFHPSYLSVDM